MFLHSVQVNYWNALLGSVSMCVNVSSMGATVGWDERGLATNQPNHTFHGRMGLLEPRRAQERKERGRSSERIRERREDSIVLGDAHLNISFRQRSLD